MANSKIGTLARQFIDLWWKEQGAKGLRKAVAEKLLEHFHRHHVESFTVESDTVVLEATAKKCPTKLDLELHFGKKKAEEFWAKLAPSKSVYLTVKPTKAEAKEAS